MLLVAVLWSFTSDLDKMGKQACDAFVVFVATQRFCMFVPTFCVAARRRGSPSLLHPSQRYSLFSEYVHTHVL